MKYIITESQWENWLRRRISPEDYFEYVRFACNHYDDRGVDLEQFVQDIHSRAIDDFLLAQFDYVNINDELYEAYEDCLINCFDGKILKYIKDFYYKYDIGTDEELYKIIP